MFEIMLELIWELQRNKHFVWLRKNWAKLILVLFFLAVAFWSILMNYLGYVISNGEPWQNISAVIRNFGLVLASIAIGLVIIVYLNGRRQEEQLKEQLLIQLGSKNLDVVETAYSVIKTHDWHKNGFLEWTNMGVVNLEKTDLIEVNLKGAGMTFANLGKAKLSGANLERTDLALANLEEANLFRANLKGADLDGTNLKAADLAESNLKEGNLSWANLKGANLEEANLEGANLSYAKLQDGKLFRANLKGANLTRANLEGAILEGANLNGVNLRKVEGLSNVQLATAADLGDAIMPDGTRLYSENAEAGSGLYSKHPRYTTLEFWLESQRQLPPGERVIHIKDEIDIKPVEQKQPELPGPVTQSQENDIKRKTREIAQGAGVHVMTIYRRIWREFGGVEKTSEFTQDQYPAVMEFLGRMLNERSSLEEGA